jgi:phosphoribosylformylglycinamidine cyclo-ligase
MYQVFNMGARLEIYTDNKTAEDVVRIAESFGIDAQISGRFELAEQKELLIESEYGQFRY